MSRQTKKWLGIAALLVVIGLIMFAAVMTVYHWDFTRLSTVKYETNTYEVSEEFSNITVNTEIGDIRFEPSDDGTCRVVCREVASEKHSVVVQDGTLTINAANERKWYDYIGITIGAPKITVYLPESEYKEIAISGSTGDVSLKNVIATEKLSVERSTGDVDLDGCDAGEIFIKTNTGEVTGSLLSEKVFLVQTDIGSIDVPKTTTGGRCEIRTNTGDIRVKIQ